MRGGGKRAEGGKRKEETVMDEKGEEQDRRTGETGRRKNFYGFLPMQWPATAHRKGSACLQFLLKRYALLGDMGGRETLLFPM